MLRFCRVGTLLCPRCAACFGSNVFMTFVTEAVLAVAKKCLARGARTTMPNKSTTLKIKLQNLQNGTTAWAQKRAHPTI